MRRNAIHWFAGALALILLLSSAQSIPAAEQGATPSSDADLLKQLRDQNTNYVICDKDGSVVAVRLFLTEKDIKRISGLPSIRELHLFGGSLTEEGIAALQKLTNLTTLHICGRNLNNNDLWGICQLNQLRHLGLMYMDLSPADLPYLASMTNLTELSLSHAQMLGTNALPALAGLVRLKELKLYGYSKIPETSILKKITCLTNLANLEELQIGDFPDFGDQQLRELSHVPKLKRLYFWRTSVSENWPDIVQPFPALTNAVEGQGEKTRTWTRNH